MNDKTEKTASYKSNHNIHNRSGGISVFVCVVVLAYLLICSLVYFFGSGTSTYTVTSGNTAGKYESQYTALILRDETVITSSYSGYINFLAADTSSVYVGEETYVIDESGELSAALEEAASNQNIISSDNLSDIRASIYDFDTSFNTGNYSDVYSFKYKLQSQILELINSSVFKNLDNSTGGAYKVGVSDTAGIIIHSIDGFENITVDDIEANSFKKTDYNKTIIRTDDLVSAGSEIYKIVTSDEWQLVFQIDDIDVFTDTDSLTVEFLKDGIEADCNFYTMTSGGNSYGVLSLNKYMIRYVSDRYLQIKLIDDTVMQGLLIPKTAFCEKQYYMIPADYATQGGNTSSYGFLRQITGADGSSTVEFIIPDIIKTTDDYYYVSMDYFSDGDVIVMPNSENTYQIAAKENLSGVFVSSGGYAEFRLAEILGENGSYFVVKSGLTNGVKIYDQVIRDSSDVSEGDSVSG